MQQMGLDINDEHLKGLVANAFGGCPQVVGVEVGEEEGGALWARITKNTAWSTGPLTRLFARLLVRWFAGSLAPLTRSLAPHYSLRSRTPLCSLRSLAPLTSLTLSLVGQ